MSSEQKSPTDNEMQVVIVERGKSGAYGAVWKARQGDRDVAVKVIHSAIQGTALAMKHFRALTRVESHKNVVRVYSLEEVTLPDENEPVLAIVMEWLEGPTLEERLKGPLFGLDDAKRICHEILDGLEFMHDNGIAHRDLHAGNIILTPHGVKLIDIDCSQEYSLARLSIGAQDIAISADVGFARLVVWSVIAKSNADLTDVGNIEVRIRNADSIQELRNQIERFRSQSSDSISSSALVHISVAHVEAMIESRKVVSLRRTLLAAATEATNTLIGPHFSTRADANLEAYKKRIDSIEKELEPLLSAIVPTSYWGLDNSLVVDVVAMVGNCHDELGMPGGTNWWLDLQAYPAHLAITTAGIAALIGKNYSLIKSLCDEIPYFSDHEDLTLSENTWNKIAGYQGLWNQSLFPGKDYATPVSMHLEDCLAHSKALPAPQTDAGGRDR